MSTLSPNHPKQTFLCFVAQDITDEIRIVFQEFVGRLSGMREWLIRPLSLTEDEDTLGAFIEIYSALPPNHLPTDIDKQHFEEVNFFVEELQKFSAQNELALEFELDGKFVGSIEDGTLDNSLEEGLLSEWEKNLEMQ